MTRLYMVTKRWVYHFNEVILEIWHMTADEYLESEENIGKKHKVIFDVRLIRNRIYGNGYWMSGAIGLSFCYI